MTERMTLLLGGTGKTGRRVAAGLTARHRLSGSAPDLASRPFDWENPGTWPAALEGTEAVSTASVGSAPPREPSSAASRRPLHPRAIQPSIEQKEYRHAMDAPTTFGILVFAGVAMAQPSLPSDVSRPRTVASPEGGGASLSALADPEAGRCPAPWLRRNERFLGTAGRGTSGKLHRRGAGPARDGTLCLVQPSGTTRSRRPRTSEPS